jgi:hypothetical protein
LKLYKFREININNLSALANNQLWFSSLNDFNDPFEGSHIKENDIDSGLLSGYEIELKSDVGAKQYKEMLDELNLIEGAFTKEEFFQSMAEHDLDEFIEIVHSSKIVCLSIEQEIDNPLTNNLMWSHYANGLRGYCLVFDGNELLKDMYSSTTESIRPIIVEYQDQPNVLKLNDFLKSEGLLKSEEINFVQKVTETVATKSSDWKYENEFRIMSLSKNDFHCYLPTTLKEIIVGDKMPISEKNLLLSIAKKGNPNIKVKTARLKTNTYQIEIV